jgi:glucosamine-6-phosphate deaminase
MIVHVFDNAKKASLAAAHLFAAQILKKPDSVLGLATGSTPLDTYQQLIKWHKAGWLDFSRCVSFNLDEYVGLRPDHPQSYRRFMQENLFDHINMKATHVPDGSAANLKREATRYDKAIASAGGIDIQFLGIGNNGHIGFNEPANVFSYGTQVVNLTRSTIEANTRFFDKAEDVPRQAISLGTGGIMNARTIVMVAFGKEKAKAVKAMVKGEVDPKVQASILSLHKQTVVLLDGDAASLL